MRKKTQRLILAILVIAARYLIPYTLLVSQPVNNVAGRVVVIDPGHGGIDPGCVGKSGVLEKDLVLAIAKKLETKLNSYTIYTVLTRETDIDLAPEVKGPLIKRKRVDLNKRAELATKHNADILVSIHINSFPESRWSGAQTFYYADSGPGRILAQTIQKSLVVDLGPNNRKAKPGDFRILRETKVASAMVEVGFLSNPREEKLLQDPQYQERIANAIAKGIVEYFESGGASQVSAIPIKPEIFVGPVLKEDEALVFYASAENNGLLNYEKRKVPSINLENVLQMLLSSPLEKQNIQLLNKETTKITALGQVDDCAYITLDFSECGFNGRLEELAVYSVVNTLTMLPGIKEIYLEVIGGSEEFDWNEPLKFNAFLVKGKTEEL